MSTMIRNGSWDDDTHMRKFYTIIFLRRKSAVERCSSICESKETEKKYDND
jgi:hypothetical protein